MGRESERRALDALVAGARLGRSGVLLLVGEPGIGSRPLLDYVASRAEGMYVVRVAGAEAERDLPFGALALAMGTATADLDASPPRRRRRCGPLWRSTPDRRRTGSRWARPRSG